MNVATVRNGRIDSEFFGDKWLWCEVGVYSEFGNAGWV
jgi:hypothetical protein